MKKSIGSIFLAIVFLTVLLSGCAPAPTPVPPTFTPLPRDTPLPTKTPVPTKTPIPSKPPEIQIYISPFYDSDGPKIDVGNYSKELSAANIDELLPVIEKMRENKALLTPEQMYVAAIRLYEYSAKDEATYWFYEAQFRMRLFLAALDKDKIGGIGSKAFELESAYGAFYQLAGPYFNGYAGCDLDNWIRIIHTVQNNNKTSPDLSTIFPDVSFMPKDGWQALNDETSSGMNQLVDYIEQNRSTWKQQRDVNNLDEIFCK
jgi:hypothetical protein